MRLQCLSRLRRLASAASETLSRLACQATVASGGPWVRAGSARKSREGGWAQPSESATASGSEERGTRVDAGKRRCSSQRRLQKGLQNVRNHLLASGQRGEVDRQLPKLFGSRYTLCQADGRDKQSPRKTHGPGRQTGDAQARAEQQRREGAQGPRSRPGLRIQGRKERICFQISKVMLEWSL